MSKGKLNIRWAATLVENLANAGVERAVISPGSRSTPLAIACDTYLNTKVLVDERSAAFYAIGLAKATGQPVVLVCTSGTAVANWYPAVVEASYGRIPLILLSADRPPELLGFGANQTIDQVKIFGDLIRGYYGLSPAEYSVLPTLATIAARAVEQSLWPIPGPVHINVPFREPLFSNADTVLTSSSRHVERLLRPILQPNPELIVNLAARLAGHPGLIICGELAYDTKLAEAIISLATALDCPIFADPLSNLRRGQHSHQHILCYYDAWVNHHTLTDLWGPQWLIQFGTMPISKRLHKQLSHLKPTLQAIIDPQGIWPDPQHAATLIVRADPTLFCIKLVNLVNTPKSGIWRQVLRPLERLAAQRLTELNIPLEWAIVQELMAELPPKTTLFVGNSMPIRDLDACLGPDSKPLQILANRGASGIDGSISTLAGLAAASCDTVIGIIGDLALFHDLNGLHALQNSNVILIIINNGGGGIFRYLAQSRLPTFEKNWLTPTGLDISKAAILFGINYQKITCRKLFTTAIKNALSNGGARIIEVVIDPELSVTQHREYWTAIETSK